MKFAANQKKRAAVINITSLIDVMFLMLIFVLLCAKFEKDNGVSVALPRGASQESVAPEIKVLSIDRAGNLFFDKEKINLAQLPAAITKMRQEMSDPVLVINADKDAAYGVFAEAIDLIKQSQQTKFYFKTTTK